MNSFVRDFDDFYDDFNFVMFMNHVILQCTKYIGFENICYLCKMHVLSVMFETSLYIIHLVSRNRTYSE